LKETCPALLTIDVLQNKSFVAGMESCLKAIFHFNTSLNTYKSGQQKKISKSKLFLNIEHVNEKLISLK